MSSSVDSSTINRVWPDASDDLTDAEIVATLVTGAPTLRVNFVSSVDGSATHNGRSGGLSGEADKRHFELLRRVCDVVLVGAGTVREEGYGPMRVSAESARWRLENGLSEHPVFAIVSTTLAFDPQSEIFTDAPVRPILFSTPSGAERAAAFDGIADVVIAGTDLVPGSTIVSELHARGLTSILCEGGPHLFGSLLNAGVVDELFLTVSPTLEAGESTRIAAGALGEAVPVRLTSVLASGSTLLLRYRS